jgi:hypothetical protein
MDEWTRLTGNQVFISDLGKNQTQEIGGEPMVIGRYAVWAPIPKTERHQVVEVGEDIAYLMEKYQVPSDLVLCLKGQPESTNA